MYLGKGAAAGVRSGGRCVRHAPGPGCTGARTARACDAQPDAGSRAVETSVPGRRGEDRHDGSDLLGRRGAVDHDRRLGRTAGGRGRGVAAWCVLAGPALGRRRGHSGMFPCFLGGSVARLVRSARSALVTFIRVFDGVMTVSMYPRSAAT